MTTDQEENTSPNNGQSTQPADAERRPDREHLPAREELNDSIADMEEFSPGRAIREIGYMAMRKMSKGGEMFDSLDKEQKDKLIEGMVESEKNQYNYHLKKLDNDKEVQLRQITANTAGGRNTTFLITAVLVVALVISVIILLMKDTFFSQWLSFITGIAGGFGLSKIGPKTAKTNSESKDEND